MACCRSRGRGRRMPPPRCSSARRCSISISRGCLLTRGSPCRRCCPAIRARPYPPPTMPWQCLTRGRS
uniref:Uncharacterized protein n=1 Tax=Arundo donax TaxID=35708 RepID=A0A0A9G7S9_ARUDO